MAVSRRDQMLFIRPGGEVVCVEPVDVGWLSATLGRALQPVGGRELLRGASAEQARTLGQLLAEGVLHQAGPPARAAKPVKKPCRHLVLGVSGAVSAMHTPSFLLPLLFQLCERIDVILTDASTHFLAPEALAYLGVGVWQDAYAPNERANVPHVHLARAAEVVLVAPASASTLARLASGACSDLLSLVVAATDAPVVVAPSMNSGMWRKPAVARNVAQLREDGVFVVEPGAGLEVSEGAAARPELGGMGVHPQNVLELVASVLALSRG